MNIKNFKVLRKIAYIFMAGVGVFACVTPPDYPKEPHIQFLNYSKNTMRQGEFGFEDTTFVHLSFTDGDGDLGGDSLAVFFRDVRLNYWDSLFQLPKIPSRGASAGVSGTIELQLGTTCCLDIIPPCRPSATKLLDTIVYEIYIKDRAGNKSNYVRATPLYLQCR